MEADVKNPLAGVAVVAMCVMPGVAGAQSNANTTGVRVYDATQLAMAQYTIVKRIWVETWRSAFEIPVRATAEAATRELVAEATALGADGVVNLTCIPSSSSLLIWPQGYRCYGDAIKLKSRSAMSGG
jgi:hypothetical protein